MKKFFLGFLAVVFPFIIFLFYDLPGAAFMALGLQTTVIGWPIAIIWAFKQLNKQYENERIQQAAAAAAAAAEASVRAKAEAEAKVRAEMEAEARMRAEAEAKVRAEEMAKQAKAQQENPSNK